MILPLQTAAWLRLSTRGRCSESSPAMKSVLPQRLEVCPWWGARQYTRNNRNNLLIFGLTVNDMQTSRRLVPPARLYLFAVNHSENERKEGKAMTTKIMVTIREASDQTGLSYYAVRKLWPHRSNHVCEKRRQILHQPPQADGVP